MIAAALMSACKIHYSSINPKLDVGDLLILGNPLVGKPIAAEHMSAEPMTSRFGCGSFIPAPTWCTNGRIIRAATVWLMKVAMTRINAAKTTRTP